MEHFRERIMWWKNNPTSSLSPPPPSSPYQDYKMQIVSCNHEPWATGRTCFGKGCAVLVGGLGHIGMHYICYLGHHQQNQHQHTSWAPWYCHYREYQKHQRINCQILIYWNTSGLNYSVYVPKSCQVVRCHNKFAVSHQQHRKHVRTQAFKRRLKSNDSELYTAEIKR